MSEHLETVNNLRVSGFNCAWEENGMFSPDHHLISFRTHIGFSALNTYLLPVPSHHTHTYNSTWFKLFRNCFIEIFIPQRILELFHMQCGQGMTVLWGLTFKFTFVGRPGPFINFMTTL